VNGIGIQAHDPPARRDRRGEQIEDPAWAAAVVDGAPPRFEADPAEQRDVSGRSSSD